MVGRLVAAVALLWACLVAQPLLRRPAVARRAVRSLFGFGAWMTVSNVVGPLMVYFDRFVIGAVLTIAAVAYYATPFELVTKILMLPMALASVLFPVFSVAGGAGGTQSFELYRRAMKVVTLGLFPIYLTIVALAPELLTFWLNAEFAAQAATVLQWLALGCLFNGVAHIPFALVQGRGAVALSAKIHLMEVPVYFVLLWIGIQTFGVVGVAVAWTVRCAIDWALFTWVAARFECGRGKLTDGTLVLACAATMAGFLTLHDVLARIALLAIVLAMLAWLLLCTEHILSGADRNALLRKLRAAAGR